MIKKHFAASSVSSGSSTTCFVGTKNQIQQKYIPQITSILRRKRLITGCEIPMLM
jgi:hypothetical protein